MNNEDDGDYLSKLNKAVYKRKHNISVDYSSTNSNNNNNSNNLLKQFSTSLIDNGANMYDISNNNNNNNNNNKDDLRYDESTSSIINGVNNNNDLWTMTKSTEHKSPPPSQRDNGIISINSSNDDSQSHQKLSSNQRTSKLHTTVSQSGFKQITPSDIVNSSETRAGQAVPVSPKVQLFDWSTIQQDELIHRQGLKAPPMVMALHTNISRPYFQLYIPQTSTSQSESCIVCRKKQKKDKWRFSLDPNRFTKGNNPEYAGKMKLIDDGYIVTSKMNEKLALICVSNDRGKEGMVHVKLLNEKYNIHEPGTDGLILSGNINSHHTPLLSLKVDSSKRTVLEIHKPNTNDKDEHRYLIEYDYPLTIFLCCAICCALETNRLLLKS